MFSATLLTGFLYSLASSQRRAVAIAQDMTKHLRESETNLAEAHALLSDAQKLAGVGCCQYTPVTERMIWSEELYRIHGVDQGTFTPTYATVMELVHPDDRTGWKRVLLNTLANGEPFTTEFRILRPDGAVRHVRSLGEVMTDLAGRRVEVLWSVLDITDQKQTEHALRSSAEQLTALSRRLVEIQETERRQLSRELHDRVGQNLGTFCDPAGRHRARMTCRARADKNCRRSPDSPRGGRRLDSEIGDKPPFSSRVFRSENSGLSPLFFHLPGNP